MFWKQYCKAVFCRDHFWIIDISTQMTFLPTSQSINTKTTHILGQAVKDLHRVFMGLIIFTTKPVKACAKRVLFYNSKVLYKSD